MQPVIYSEPSGTTYLIDAHGIRCKQTSSINVRKELIPHRHNLWYLVDSPYQQDILRSLACVLPFYVVFASPQHGWCEKLVQHGARKWVMALWNDEELLGL